MVTEVLKGFLIGICASAPIGPIAILVVQKTLSKGYKAGFVTSLGATVVDTLFATIALFFLALAQEIMDAHQTLILMLGGVVVAALGILMSRSDPFRKLKTDDHSPMSAKDFAQALFMGLSNPGAIVVIFGLFAFFGIGDSDSAEGWKIWPIIAAVSIGSAVYWTGIVAMLNHFRKKVKMHTILWINRITGGIVFIIGIVLLIQGLYKLFMQIIPLG